MLRLMLCHVLLLGGCASHAVRCDAHLSPINAPAPKSNPTPGAAP